MAALVPAGAPGCRAHSYRRLLTARRHRSRLARSVLLLTTIRLLKALAGRFLLAKPTREKYLIHLDQVQDVHRPCQESLDWENVRSDRRPALFRRSSSKDSDHGLSTALINSAVVSKLRGGGSRGVESAYQYPVRIDAETVRIGCVGDVELRKLTALEQKAMPDAGRVLCI